MNEVNTVIDKRCTNIYEHVQNGGGLVPRSSFLEGLERKGILNDDPRIADFIKSAQAYANLLSKDAFLKCISKNVGVIESALTNSNIIPDFEAYTSDIKAIHDACVPNTEGKVTDAVPHLPKHNQDHFAVSLCTIDGQRYNIGDTSVDFCLQSCAKPINYCLSSEEHGMEKIHSHVGREPSGIAYNALKLNANGLPHNPLINSGAIMICSLIKNHMTAAARFEYIISMWKKLAGGNSVGYSKGVYQSERMTGFRNFALAYIMEEHKSFPNKVNLVDVLENYFRCQSLTIKANFLSIVAATLANGGVCPLTNEQVLSTETVKHCLSTMYACGMYDYSGEFAFKSGLPGSSSTTGGIFVVIPNVMGICTYSPRLDKYGISARGVDFFSRLAQKFNFHLFENMLTINKRNPREESNIDDMAVEKVIKCSSIGDLSALRRLRVSAVKLKGGDYDKRTPLHLAASNGHLNVVKYLLEQIGMDNSNPVDRWGGTPYDDALREQYYEVAQYLRSIGGTKGSELNNT